MTVKIEQATPTGAAATTYVHAPTETIDVGGTRFAYRQLGADTGVQEAEYSVLDAALARMEADEVAATA